MVLSLSPVSQEQGRTYYKRDNYYSKDQAQEYSQWWGKGAGAFGLSGEVQFEAFDNLLHGLSPDGLQVLSNDLSRKISDKRMSLFVNALEKTVSQALRVAPRTDPIGLNEKLERAAEARQEVASQPVEATTATAEDKPVAPEPAAVKPEPVKAPSELELLRNQIVAEAVGQITGKTLAASEIKEGRERILQAIEAATRTKVFLGAVGNEGVKITHAEAVTEKQLKDLKKKISKAYGFAAQGMKRDRSALLPKKKAELLGSIQKILTDKGIQTSAVKAAIKRLDKDLGDKRPTANRIKTLVGHIMKEIGDGLPANKLEQISLRKALKEELGRFKTIERRAALDMTFSAPKSVSIHALVFEKQELVDAHRRAVNKALRVIEDRYSNYRGGTKGNQTTELAGNLTVAQFEHDTSRAKDPDLHTHCVAISLLEVGKDANGKPIYKALFNEALYKNSKLAGVIYKNELARELKALGYKLIDHGNGAFDIEGYTKDQLDVFSKRRIQIVEAGGTDAKKARDKVMEGRAAKGPEIPRAQLLSNWLKEGQSVGLSEVKPSAVPLKVKKLSIEKAVEAAIRQASERSVSFSREQIELILLQNNLGRYAFADVQAAVAKEIGRTMIPSNKAGIYVSLHSLRLERQYKELAEKQLKCSLPLMNQDAARVTLDRIAKIALDQKGRVMTEGQKDAILKTLQSQDGIIIWQGVAGAGKTDSLRPIVEHLKSEGHQVKGYAQAASAAQQLSEGAGIKAETLETMLIKDPKPFDFREKQEFWIVDEASFISSKDMVRLLEHQKASGARIILTGDTRQLSAVEAGNPFLDLQQSTFKGNFAELNESVRQKDKQLKEAVALMNKGDVVGGLKHLDDRIREVSNAKRPEAVAKFYLSLPVEEREKSIVVARTNLERHEITEKIREGLRAEGRLGEAHKLMVYEKKDIPQERLSLAVSVKEGDYLVPAKDIKGLGLKKNEGYEVLQRDIYRNTVTVRAFHNGADSVTVNLRTNKDNVSFYGASEIKIHEGDTMAWTRNQKGESRLNNDRVKVLGIKEGKADIQYESGRVETIDLQKRHFLDQALVITTNKSQGMSKHRNIVSVDSGKQQEALYVDVTRAVNDLVIFCEDKEKLYEQASRDGSNKVASSLVADDIDYVDARLKEVFEEPAFHQTPEQDEELGLEEDYDGPSW